MIVRTSASRRTPLSIRRKLLFALLTLTLCALAGEIGLRFARPQFLRFAYDWRQAHRWTPWGHDLRPNAEVRFVLWHASGRPLWDFDVRTNELALRAGSDPDHASISAAPTLVHCIGDSFTFGWGVQDEQSYPAALGRALGSQYQVLNLGDPGIGLIGAAKKCELLSASRRPDVIVWLFDESDLTDDAKSEQALRRGRLGGTASRVWQACCAHSYLACAPWGLTLYFGYRDAVARPLEIPVPRERTRDEFIAGVRSLTQSIEQTSPSSIAHDHPTLRQLAAFGRRCAAQNQRLVVVLHRAGPGAAAVHAAARRENIEVVCFPQFSEWLIPGDFHFNAEGNRSLAMYLQANVFPPTTP